MDDFCGAETEDDVHLFLITFIVMFWIDLKGLLCTYLCMKVYLSEKDVFFYFNRERLPPNVTFIVNLCLIMGKYHIHKQKWTKGKLNFLLFQIDMKHYIELLLGLKNKQNTQGLYVNLLRYLYDCLISFSLFSFLYFTILFFIIIIINYFIFVSTFYCMFSYFTYSLWSIFFYKICWND